MDNVINGCYRLSWRERIGFCSGDLAQNLIYQTVSIWLLFYYNNVYGLDSAVVAVMFLVVRIIDVVWDPMVGAIVDKSHPRWGKYRSWLILGAVLLATFATLCFWNGFSGSLLYAYVTYVGMSMSFTFVNVPYAALGSSLTRDTDEITILAFIFMPMVPAIKRRIGKNGMFRLFLGIAIVAMLLMYLMMSVESLKSITILIFFVQFVKSTGVVVATGYMWALVPEVVTFSEYASGHRVAGIVNALICIFMKAGMALGGVIPGLVLAWVGFKAGESVQTPLAEQGILWLVTLIPAVLFVLAIFVIGKYELSDEKIDELNHILCN